MKGQELLLEESRKRTINPPEETIKDNWVHWKADAWTRAHPNVLLLQVAAGDLIPVAFTITQVILWQDLGGHSHLHFLGPAEVAPVLLLVRKTSLGALLLPLRVLSWQRIDRHQRHFCRKTTISLSALFQFQMQHFSLKLWLFPLFLSLSLHFFKTFQSAFLRFTLSTLFQPLPPPAPIVVYVWTLFSIIALRSFEVYFHFPQNLSSSSIIFSHSAPFSDFIVNYLHKYLPQFQWNLYSHLEYCENSHIFLFIIVCVCFFVFFICAKIYF